MHIIQILVCIIINITLTIAGLKYKCVILFVCSSPLIIQFYQLVSIVEAYVRVSVLVMSLNIFGQRYNNYIKGEIAMK